MWLLDVGHNDWRAITGRDYRKVSQWVAKSLCINQPKSSLKSGSNQAQRLASGKSGTCISATRRLFGDFFCTSKFCSSFSIFSSTDERLPNTEKKLALGETQDDTASWCTFKGIVCELTMAKKSASTFSSSWLIYHFYPIALECHPIRHGF